MRRRELIGCLAATVVAVLLTGLSTPGDGASPGLYGGVSYLGVGELAAEIVRRQEDLERAEKRMEEIEQRIARLEPEIEEAEEARRAQALKARQSIILHDRMARGGWLRMALSSGSLTELSVFTRLYGKMLETEGEALSELRDRQDVLLAKREALADDRDMLEKLRSDLVTHRKELEARRQTLMSLKGGSAGYITP
jgi:septal ring factor EnvC (AmiA/AmiB activator)